MWLGLAAELVAEPSPKSHSYEAMESSGSEEPAEENATTSGALPEDGVATALTTGAWFALELIVTGVVWVAPSLSVTVRAAVHVPTE